MKIKIPEKVKPYLFLLPVIVLIGFWVYRPMLQTLQYSMYKWNMVPGTQASYVGFENFIKLLTKKEFGIAVANTVFYILGMLPFSVVIPLFLSVATQSLADKVKNGYRAFFFLPMIMAPVAIGIIFQWLFHPTNGIVNSVLQKTGLIEQVVPFLSDQATAKYVIAFIAGWKMIGFSTLMFSAALTGIDTQYYEASRMDGVGAVRRFFDITLVMLSPTVMLMLMMSILFSSQSTFAYIDVLTQGGPLNSTTNIYYLMYKYAFSDMNVGLSAAATILFLVVFGVIAIALQLLTKKIAFYDN